ncbi:hypothetical protein [Modestobacter sp. VKM Ac-2985]|uniref:hypothetical protein n=1 Tax=Modestobacter sp. VKM Ac-2985 TaxID=3004139 RepID=UPI0022AB979A|nr:hypothetical protein [Modestobacter sp. VKM Ac-2985]MCZ2837000.1 hypothetical protein [Modestobacter sp. VKM Ac-2985]
MLQQVTDDQRAWRLGRVVTVVDRDPSSAADLDDLRRGRRARHRRERMRAGTAHVEDVLARPGRHRQVRDDLQARPDAALGALLGDNETTRQPAPPPGARPR